MEITYINHVYEQQSYSAYGRVSTLAFLDATLCDCCENGMKYTLGVFLWVKGKAWTWNLNHDSFFQCSIFYRRVHKLIMYHFIIHQHKFHQIFVNVCWFIFVSPNFDALLRKFSGRGQSRLKFSNHKISISIYGAWFIGWNKYDLSQRQRPQFLVETLLHIC